MATRLALEESTPLLYLERLRLAADAPLAVDRVWLPASLAAPLLKADFTHAALYDELAGRCGIRLCNAGSGYAEETAWNQVQGVNATMKAVVWQAPDRSTCRR